MSEFRRALALSRFERRLLAETIVALVSARVGLRAVSFGRLRRWLARLADRPERSDDRIEVADVRWALRAATANLPGEFTCLHAALAATAVCRRRGLPAELRIGVATDDDLRAHAWVEHHDEIVIGGTPQKEFVPFPPFENT